MTADMQIEFATCSYSEFRPEMGVPVRSSVGAPKFFRYSPIVRWDNTFPLPYMLRMGKRDEFKEHYFRVLDGHGVEKLMGDAEFILTEYRLTPGANQHTNRLVVLCYEHPLSRSKWCHRSLWAEWMRANAGVEVTELGDHDPHAFDPPQEPPLSLW